MQSNIDYEQLKQECLALKTGHFIADLANWSSQIYHTLPNLNWCGFYLWDGKQLVVGPFQGRPACVEIQMGKGVCGSALQQNKTLRVANVHEFPGHIACDERSQSEIVVPIYREGHPVGVLDLDAPVLDRFSKEDQSGLEQLIAALFSES